MRSRRGSNGVRTANGAITFAARSISADLTGKVEVISIPAFYRVRCGAGKAAWHPKRACLGAKPVGG
jgi:hypothetical protein